MIMAPIEKTTPKTPHQGADVEKFLRDIRDEPAWRYDADRAAEYYDGNQLSNETLSRMQELGLSPLIRNLVGPTVDVVLGMEAKSKRDWKVTPDEEPAEDFAAALTQKLRDAERLSKADQACSNAYASQIKTGVGWVEVQREMDPFRSPYRVRSIHRREVFWDWRSRELDLADARYVVRRKWFDEDQLIAVFPEHEELISHTVSTWADWDMSALTGQAPLLSRHYEAEARTSLEQQEWLDVERRRLCLYEVWYRTWQRGQIIRLPGNHVIEYDPDNPQHAQAVENHLVTPEPTVLPKIRLTWWLGPHQLYDLASPYGHNQFPYVPFWGYREDATDIPYGLVRRMMSPQDEVNARLSKMMWLLSAKRVIMDEDAVEGTMTMDQVQREAARPDAMFVLNQTRRYQQAFSVESDREMSVQQFNVLKDASEAIQDTAGVYQAMLGKDSSADSGVAIANLVEQGATTLAEINDNFNSAKTQVGELLLSLVKDEMGRDETTVQIQRQGVQVPVTLNEMQVDEYGYTYRNNDIMRIKAQVGLEETPSTPSYRNLILTQLTELTKSLPPELQAIVMDLVVEATDIPVKNEIAERLRKATGQGEPTPEQAQMEAQQQQMEQEAQELELQSQQGKIGESQARIEKMLAEVQRIIADTANKNQDVRLKEDKHSMELDQHVEEQVQAGAVPKKEGQDGTT